MKHLGCFRHGTVEFLQLFLYGAIVSLGSKYDSSKIGYGLELIRWCIIFAFNVSGKFLGGFYDAVSWGYFWVLEHMMLESERITYSNSYSLGEHFDYVIVFQGWCKIPYVRSMIYP